MTTQETVPVTPFVSKVTPEEQRERRDEQRELDARERYEQQGGDDEA